MKKVFQLLGKAKAVAGDFGVEIEVEGNNLPHVGAGGWRCERDGSLRGESMEYIFDKPLPQDKVAMMIDYLNEQFKEVGSVLNFSFRTSVHVHMNVQDLTANQVLNVIYTYLLLEEPIINYVGKERKGNRFCLRLQDAEGLLNSLSEMFKQGEDYLLQVPQDSARYASINVEAMAKYGSIEFRAMRGNNNTEFISNWTKILYNIRAFACEMADPTAVFNLYQEKGANEFFKAVLKDMAPVIRYPRLSKDIELSFSLSLDLPFMYREGEVQRVAKAKEKEEAAARRKAMLDEMAKNPGAVMRGVLDQGGLELRMGDRVIVTHRIKDYAFGWNADMEGMVHDGNTYVVTRIREDKINLLDSPYIFPPASLTILRRKKANEEI